MNHDSVFAAPSERDPVKSLLWLTASLGKSHKDILKALLEMADCDGRIWPGTGGAIYQLAAFHVECSPGYANRILNELSWYGLVRPEKSNVVFPGGKRRLADGYLIVGFDHYEHWSVQCVLNAEHISGRSMRCMEPDWQQRVATIA